MCIESRLLLLLWPPETRSKDFQHCCCCCYVVHANPRNVSQTEMLYTFLLLHPPSHSLFFFTPAQDGRGLVAVACEYKPVPWAKRGGREKKVEATSFFFGCYIREYHRKQEIKKTVKTYRRKRKKT